MSDWPVRVLLVAQPGFSLSFMVINGVFWDWFAIELLSFLIFVARRLFIGGLPLAVMANIELSLVTRILLMKLLVVTMVQHQYLAWILSTIHQILHCVGVERFSYPSSGRGIKLLHRFRWLRYYRLHGHLIGRFMLLWGKVLGGLYFGFWEGWSDI